METVRIRQCRHDEVWRIAEMGEHFAALLPHSATYHPEGVENMARWLLDTPNKTILVAVTSEGKIIGAVAGTVDPMYQYVIVQEGGFRNYMLAQEIFWWVEPEFRKTTRAGAQLLEAWETWASMMGADGITMMNFDHLDPAPAVIYKKRGYKLYENHYLKEF